MTDKFVLVEADIAKDAFGGARVTLEGPFPEEDARARAKIILTADTGLRERRADETIMRISPNQWVVVGQRPLRGALLTRVTIVDPGK